MEKLTVKLSHIEINVSDYAKSIRFYDVILCPLGWERLVCTSDFTAYSDGYLKLILCPVSAEYKSAGFHRKRIGLNHIALYANRKEDVDRFYSEVMQKNGIKSLYQNGPEGNDLYYSILFEDPDRMKVEVVCAPQYCDKECWPNNIPSNFDPYKECE
jgi:catechol 2,3-dioxygenase-like lactoylglutathione lyase family enzyme